MMHPNDDFFSSFIRETPIWFQIFFGLILVLVLGTFAYIIFRSLAIWMANNRSELMTLRCRVTDKRTEVWGGSGDSGASTTYYITFEFDDRTRKEFYVKPNQYGLIAVGDTGELTFRGTRFIDFKRF